MIMRITRDYKRPAIEVTESGCSYGDAPDAKGMVNDTRRIAYYQVLSSGGGSVDTRRRRRSRTSRLELDRQFRMGRGIQPALRIGLCGFQNAEAHHQRIGQMVCKVGGRQRHSQLALGEHNLAILNFDSANIVGQLQPISLFHQPLLQRIVHQ